MVAIFRHVLASARRFLGDRRGNIAMTFAFAALPIAGIVGAGPDYSRHSVGADAGRCARRQSTPVGLDGVSQSSSSRNTLATATFEPNFHPFAGVTDTTPSFTTNSDGSFTGSVQITIPLTFGSLFGTTNTTVSLTSTANASQGASPNKICILVLDPSDNQTLLVNSGVTLNAPQCEIDVASTSTTAAMINSSLKNVAAVCVAGGSTLNGGATVNNLTNHCKTATNALAGKITAPTVGGCTINSANYSGSTNLSPGTYCGNFNFNGTGSLNLSSGVYVFKGTHWNLNSGWSISGSNVTFYFADSSSYVQFNSECENQSRRPDQR